MALNLIRNSKVFFTTNVNATTGVVNTTGFNGGNTFEIQVLDGFSFSQSTNADTITLSEAGPTPNRGQRSYNTSLAPVDFSFSTYVRPTTELAKANAQNGTSYTGSSGQATAEEKYLWSAFASSTGYVGTTAAGWTTAYTAVVAPGYVGSRAQSVVTFGGSQAHQLAKFGIIIVLEATTYVIDNCALDQVTIDFGIDAIATLAWTGKGTALKTLATTLLLTPNANNSTYHITSGSYTGSFAAKDTNAKYIANKLSTSYVGSGVNNDITMNGYIGTNVYTVALTGGSITLSNNLTYLTPSNLGVVNTPITYFTGARAISGTMNAYLRTGTKNTAELFDAISTQATTSSDTKWALAIQMGGLTNPDRLDLVIGGAMMQVPSVTSESVISTTLNFTAQGYVGTNTANTGTYDIEQSNEAQIRYVAA